jgi:hypothetical protein
MESYIVRIYHRVGDDSRLIIGRVETMDGKQSHHFRTAEEPWWILLKESGDEATPPDAEPAGGSEKFQARKRS